MESRAEKITKNYPSLEERENDRDGERHGHPVHLHPDSDCSFLGSAGHPHRVSSHAPCDDFGRRFCADRRPLLLTLRVGITCNVRRIPMPSPASRGREVHEWDYQSLRIRGWRYFSPARLMAGKSIFRSNGRKIADEQGLTSCGQSRPPLEFAAEVALIDVPFRQKQEHDVAIQRLNQASH